MWTEDVIIPTYETAHPTLTQCFLKNGFTREALVRCIPMLLLKRSLMKKQIKAYKAVFLENRYIKVMVLPELGGRIQMAFDKIATRHFIYYNEVIKPALVGLCGPWISGGIEFNWPQHHRPTTFEPVDFCLKKTMMEVKRYG